MISKTLKRTSFRALADYVLRTGQEGAKAPVIGGSMAGRTPRELSAEYRLLRGLRPSLRRATAHIILSAAPGDRSLSDDDWAAIGERFMQEMKFGVDGECPYVFVRHRDTDNDHIHILAGRVNSHGRTISDANDWRRSEVALRKIEREFCLVAVQSSQQQKKWRNTMNEEEKKKAIEERLALGADAGEAALHEAQGREITGAECADELTDKERREQHRRILDPDYRAMLDAALGDAIKTVYPTPRGIVIYTHSGGRIHDNGNKITLYKLSDEEAARHCVALGVLRWRSIRFTGSESFCVAAMRIALDEGMTVVPGDAAQAKMLETLLGQRRGGAMGTTFAPKPAPVGPEGPKGLEERLNARRVARMTRDGQGSGPAPARKMR